MSAFPGPSPAMTLEPLGRQSRLMVIAPHPDDETLAAGGLMQQAAAAGAAVRVLFLTNGDNDPWPQRAIERRWRIGAADRARWGERRRGEALAALAQFGIPEANALFLGYPDQGLTPGLMAGDDSAADRLADGIAEWRPTLLVSPSLSDLHPDHSAAALFVRMALVRPSAEGGAPRMLEYLIHARGERGAQGAAVVLPLSPEQVERKRRSILRHASQTRFFPKRLLAFAAEREEFVAPPPAPDWADPRHPSREAAIEGGELRLRLESRACLGAFGRATLYLAANRLGRSSLRAETELPERSRDSALNLIDCATRQAIAQGRFQADRRRAEVRLPLAALPPTDQWFVKLERRHGFFDEAGWRELPAP
ncbi:MAG: PIG-L family deacetylase [Candidatus Sumerlaeota bacterium]|nr:PIG-L family deacetylase [Candidatus Sumerlaeota bacterium]